MEFPIPDGEAVARKTETVVEPVQEVGLEDPAAAKEGVAGQPDELRFQEAQAAHVLQLLQNLFARNHIGEANRRRAIAHRKRYLGGREMLPDELKHQELVEVCIEQGPDDWVQVKVMVMRPLRKINDHRCP